MKSNADPEFCPKCGGVKTNPLAGKYCQQCESAPPAEGEATAKRNCQRLLGLERRGIYDGVIEWRCALYPDKMQPRFIDDVPGGSVDPDAVDKLCAGCKDYI